MPNTIEQATRTGLGLSPTAPATVTSYNHTISIPGFPGLPGAVTRVIDGTNGANTISGTSTTNYIFGFGGNDILSAITSTGGISPAILFGGNGADTFKFTKAASNLTLTGNVADFSQADGDKIDLTATGLKFSQLTINQTSAHSFQIFGTGVNINVVTSDGTLNATNVKAATGAPKPDVGGATGGNDNLTGTAGVDTILGLGGNDTISGLGGNDTLNGNLGNDSVLGGEGNDTVAGGKDDDTVNGGAGNDRVNGNLGVDQVAGGAGNDTVRGGQGNDTVNGGEGDDDIYGDLGNDNLTGGNGADTFFFGGNHGTDVVTDFVSGEDIIHFTGLFSSAADALAAFSGGAFTTVGGTITLTGVTSLEVTDIEVSSS